jgi:hypothetical protein
MDSSGPRIAPGPDRHGVSRATRGHGRLAVSCATRGHECHAVSRATRGHGRLAVSRATRGHERLPDAGLATSSYRTTPGLSSSAPRGFWARLQSPPATPGARLPVARGRT